jgi:ABC-2 type transport system ATP-binding protein
MITVKNLTKQFGNHKVLDNVSVAFDEGKIHGIVGRNGSGKTVLFKCICGYIKPTAGTVEVNGETIGKDRDMIKNAGIILESPGFLPGYSGLKNLMFLSAINRTVTTDDLERVMCLVGLEPRNKKHVSHYSLGMKQRLGIAQAIMENPDIMILDEPMNGLDNGGVLEIRTLFMNLREQGKTFLLASHNREDIETLSDSVFYMDNGKLSSQRDEELIQ